MLNLTNFKYVTCHIAVGNLDINLIPNHLCMCRYDINMNQLQQLHSTDMTWTAAAETLGVNRSTIYRRRQLFGMNTNDENVFSDIPNADLYSILTTILQQSPNAGKTYVQGILRSRGLKIQRWRVRERLQVVL